MHVRRWLAAGFCAGLSAAALGVAAGPAVAASGATLTVSPAAPETGGSVAITADDPCSGLCLAGYPAVAVVLVDPQGCAFTVGNTSASNGKFASTFDTATDEVGGKSVQAGSQGGTACTGVDESSGYASAGTWTVELESKTPVQAALALTAPAPTGLTATATGDDTATLSWAPVAIADLSGYTVVDEDGGTPTAIATLTPAAADCPADSGTCTQTVTYPDASAAGTHTLSVETVTDVPSDTTGADAQDSAAAAPATVTLAGPPTPSPSPSASASGSASPSPSPSTSSSTGGGTGKGSPSPSTGSSASTGSSGSTGSGGSGGSVSTGAGTGHSASSGEAAAQRQVALSFSSFAPATGIAGLPPLPELPSSGTASTAGGDSPTVTDGEPTDPGTYSPTLDYPTLKVSSKEQTGKGAAAIYDDVTSSLTPNQLWRSIAAALLMLLAAAHVRTWLRRHAREDF